MTIQNASAEPPPSTPIMKRLKDETKEYHARLAALPFFKALMEHRLPLECYVNQIKALAVIQGVLENEISASSEKRVSAVWEEGLKKLPLLEEDLAFFEPRVISDVVKPVEVALAMTEKIRFRGIENPVSLLGYLYVSEGSTLGNDMHRPDVSATFHLSEQNGCRYYAGYGDRVTHHWARFSEKMNDAFPDPAVHDSIIEAAREAFSGLEALYTALYPLAGQKKSFHVTRINPEAGNHPIPDDEREIQAALKASDRGWAEFSYYEQRYGKRGKRFSDSDACWLATLASLDESALQKQIDWLRKLLAVRGMPSLPLEHTLKFLYEELSGAVPEKTAVYEKLRKAADILESVRTEAIAEDSFRSLAAEFDQAVGPEMAHTHKNTGNLIVSAAADEASGMEGAVSALLDWLTDADRFPEKWIAAVNETVEKARRAV